MKNVPCKPLPLKHFRSRGNFYACFCSHQIAVNFQYTRGKEFNSLKCLFAQPNSILPKYVGILYNMTSVNLAVN